MDRLSILLTVMIGAMVAGSVVVTAFTMGYYSVHAILIAAALSILASWPLSYLVSRRIKRQDPNWHRKPDPGLIPDPKAREV